MLPELNALPPAVKLRAPYAVIQGPGEVPAGSVNLADKVGVILFAEAAHANPHAIKGAVTAEIVIVCCVGSALVA